MALATTIDWDVRTGGNNDNGGGFKSGASGTDFSLQDAAEDSGTDLVVDGSDNTKVTSVTHNFVAADVGNVLHVTAGTSWTLEHFEIVSVASNAATLDRSPGATSLTGGTWKYGGALADPGYAAGVMVAQNYIHVKSGTYTISSTTANIAGGKIDLAGGDHTGRRAKMIGYETTHFDDTGTRPTFEVAASGVTSITVCDSSTNHSTYDNIVVDGKDKTSIAGFVGSGASKSFLRVRATQCTGVGINLSGTSFGIAWRCEADNGGTAGIFAKASVVVECIAHDNTGDGIRTSGTTCAIRCISYSNGLAGFDLSGTSPAVMNNCVAYDNTGDGFNLDGSAGRGSVVENCFAEGNGSEGFATDTSTAELYLINCGGFNNTGGNFDSGEIPTEQVINFKTITAGSPFTDAANGDFSLNDTASRGADLRAAGFPGAFPAGLTAGNIDVGAAQHADPAGGGGSGGWW